MKKLLLLFIPLGLTKGLLSQNIGIGTVTPTAKLHINHKATAASPTLRLFDSTAGTGSSLLFAKENQGNSFSVVSTIGTFAASNTLDFRTTFSSGILLRGDGRVGINNITSPTATLHVGGGVKVNDTLNVTGDVSISGKLKVNGNSGIDGQVLVSRGAASPEWINTTVNYPANERASVRFFDGIISNPSSGILLNIDGIQYNNSTATIDLTNNTITFNKAGLYHFELIYNLSSGATPATGPYCFFRMKANFSGKSFTSEKAVMYPNNSSNSGNFINFVFDHYVDAGTSLVLVVDCFNFPSGSSANAGSNLDNSLSFYLIAE